jgi:hypothetical protein
VDTLSRWAGIDGEGENSSGAADAATAPLLLAAEEGLAVWVNRHERKAGGEVGDAGRGSSAFSGAVDIALVLRRGEGNSRPTIRRIHALSRFDETPETLVVERTAGRYVALGYVQAVAREEARRAVREVLRRDDGTGMKIADLMVAESVKDFGRTTVQVALDDLMASSEVVRLGAGRRNDPYRYTLLSAGTSTQGEAEETVGDPATVGAAGRDPSVMTAFRVFQGGIITPPTGRQP